MTEPVMAPKRPATYEDLCQVPDHRIAEILDGELVVSPRPASPHAYASSTLGILIGPFHLGSGSGGSPGGWWVLFEPELHLGHDVLVPDLAGWRRERMPEIRNVPFFTLAPDWICEVVSPTTERHDRLKKMRLYAKEAVRNLWLLDPLKRTLEAYRLQDGRWLLLDIHADEEQARIEPFESIDLELGQLWLPEAAEADPRSE